MDKTEARQVLRRVNELHFEIAAIQEMEQELKQKLDLLRDAGYPAGLIRAEFIENCGRYVFTDDLSR